MHGMDTAWQLRPLSKNEKEYAMNVFLSAVPYAGIALALAEGLLVIKRKPSREQMLLLVTIFATCIYFLGCCLGVDTQTLREAVMAEKIVRVSELFIAVFMFLFEVQMCKIPLSWRAKTALACFYILVLFLVITCDTHPLFYRTIAFTTEGIFPHPVMRYGIIWFLNMFVAIGCTLFVTFICFVRYKKAVTVYEKRQLRRLAMINLVAIAGMSFNAFGHINRYSISMIVYIINLMLMLLLFLKDRLLDTLVLAKDLALDVMGEGIIVAGADGEILYFNKRIGQLCDKISLGKSDFADGTLQCMNECLKNDGTFVLDGRIYLVSRHMIEMQYGNNSSLYVLSDVTQNHQYIQKLKELKEEAEAANMAKSSFVSSMSHEIRTPMNAIVGLTDVLLRRDWKPKEKRYLLNIKSSGSALLALINDLLDFSKIEAGKYEIVNDAYDMAQMLLDIQVIGHTRIGDRNIELVMDVDRKMPRMLFGDSLRIRQVLINLMNNAIKFTEKGSVTITVKQMKRNLDAEQIYFSVKDTGLGIKEEDQKVLFDAFTQVDIKKNRGKEGTGLGLAISHELVELMGGELRVKSEYGQGSEFYFTLWQEKKSDECIGSLSDVKELAKEDSDDGFTFTAPEVKILLVDDNDLNREVAAAVLEPLAMQIDFADNGQEALDMVQKKEYDLVFMDHYMPVMDGVEATKRIRCLGGDEYLQLPILALTADAVEGVREEFLAAGMNDFVSKPISVHEIVAAIMRWIPEDKLLKQ